MLHWLTEVDVTRQMAEAGAQLGGGREARASTSKYYKYENFQGENDRGKCLEKCWTGPQHQKHTTLRPWEAHELNRVHRKHLLSGCMVAVQRKKNLYNLELASMLGDMRR